MLNLTRETETAASAMDMANVVDHDWMEVTYLLRYELPEIFREVLLKLRARYKIYLANQALDELAEGAGVVEEESQERPKNNDDGDDKDDDDESAL